MKKNYFITTPIYYTNGIPHIWHAYSSLLADCIARAKRLLWYEVKFSTWVDENSQKVLISAQKEWMKIMEYLDMMAAKHKAVWDWLDISYTDFIRTTQKDHHEYVGKILKETFWRWDIYKWDYKWLYCVWCEAFKKTGELTKEWLCLDHMKKPDEISEKNYFFKLSKYEDKLKQLYKSNPNWVNPSFRFNEIKAFVDNWLEDFSISRENNKFGINLPFDESQVAYVWYDALLNYITVCQWWQEWFWPADLHIVGKEINRFHSIYWPAMLMSVWIELPKNIAVTWFLTIEGQKISKSLWNVIDPVDLMNDYSRDAMVIYFMYDVKLWNDWDFNWERFKWLYQWNLIWWWWNLVYRATKMAQKHWVKDIDIDLEELSQIDNILLNWILEWNITDIIEKYLNNVDIQWFLRLWYELVQATNKYIDTTQPWSLIKTNKEEWLQVLKNIIWLVQKLWLLSAPFFTVWRSKLVTILWMQLPNTDKSLKEEEYKSLLLQKAFTIDLNPEIIYKSMI